MKAIVCGASVEGLTAAWWLNHAGWEVVLIEQSQRLNVKGYVIDFVRSCWDIPARMGLLVKLDPLRCPIARISWMSTGEMQVAELNYVRLEELFGMDPLVVSHGDIARTLLDLLPAKIDMRFGLFVTTVRQEPDCVVVEFADGSAERADVLIGADGVHSRVRDFVFGAQQRFYSYLGYWTAGFVVNDYSLVRRLGPDLRLMTAPGRVVGLCPMPGGRAAATFAYETTGLAIELRDIFSDFGGLVPQVLGLAPPPADMHCDRVLQVNLPRWSTDRVTLLGDACHAATAPAAQEATLAISNAYVLAAKLSQEASVGAALQSYEKQLRPTLDRKQAVGRRFRKWLVPSTDMEILLRNAALNAVNHRGMGWLLKRFASSEFGSAFVQRS
jgi:2-polyprenyl-6-methoxyphenol hydroxylase-like FAD-dependent oxidoreductase